MAKQTPGLITSWRGLWARGHKDSCPPGYLTDCRNVIFSQAGIMMRDGLYSSYGSTYGTLSDYVRIHLYKPNPPFGGINIPRLIGLKSNGELHDIFRHPSSLIHTDADWTDFALLNMFGRCYISPHNGRVGLENEVLYVYDGTTFREACGDRPSTKLNTATSATAGTLEVGTYLISFAFESSTGFISEPAPFAYIDNFGGFAVDLTSIDTGPAGTVARWIIVSQVIPFRANLADPFDVSDDSAQRFPLFFVHRIDNNTATTYTLTFYDENLHDSADYLWNTLTSIPAGVGLIDYKGRLVSYGEYDDSSLIRVSEPGEPENINETSGFIITEPSDNTGVRSAATFLEILYIFKRQRTFMVQDNGQSPSTWKLDQFDKAIGAEQYSIADVIDAKGSSSNGFLVGSVNGLYYFSGVYQEPELSYAIRDLWARIPQDYFYKVKISLDPKNKRIYCLVPLDRATAISHVIFGDYREGLDPRNIKWSIWEFATPPLDIITYTDFSADNPTWVTRLVFDDDWRNLDIDIPGTDAGTVVNAYFDSAQFRAALVGLTQATHLVTGAYGPADITFYLWDSDQKVKTNERIISIPTSNPGRDYNVLVNLVAEKMSVRAEWTDADAKINWIQVINHLYGRERPRA